MKWSPMNVEDALELLSPAFTHTKVRKYAVMRLRQADDEVSVVGWKLLQRAVGSLCRCLLNMMLDNHDVVS